MATSGLHIALAGLGFGGEFVPIYLHHPAVAEITLVDTDAERLTRVGEKFAVASSRRTTCLEDVLENPHIDAVHLVTPIPQHAAQTLAVLRAGKHCACTVPMALDLDDLHAIVATVRETGLTYMMMETAVYTREFLYVEERLHNGELGTLQFLRGAHYQDMEQWPPYWLGLPPMFYATHAIAPLLKLAGCRATRVHALGSGVMREELRQSYNNPYPVETAIFQLERENLAAEATRSLFHTARAYTESFNVYGEALTFEWQQLEEEQPVLFHMQPYRPGHNRPMTHERVDVPDYAHRLPDAIARFTRRGVYDENNPHQSFQQGGGHGGSHPHLVHEFVQSLVEQRPPAIDAVTAADWTAAGICAHHSALQQGAAVTIPAFA